MKKLLIYCSLFIVHCSLFIVQAQPDSYTRLSMMSQRSKVYVETMTFPSTEKSGVLVRFRIPYDRLVFVRNREATQGNEFVSEIKINVEVQKERARVTDETWTQKVYVSDFEASKDRSKDVEGHVTFQLDGGNYTYRIAINEQAGMLRPLRVPDFQSTSISEPFAINESGNALLNLGGDVEYGKPNPLMAFVSLKAGESADNASVSYVLHKLTRKQMEEMQRKMQGNPMRENMNRARRGGGGGAGRPSEEGATPREAEPPKFMLEAPTVPDGAEKIMEGTITSKDWKSLSNFNFQALRFNTNAFAIPLSLENKTLADGTYILKLELKTANGTQSAIHRFATHWRNMPASLMNLDAAIDNLKFVVEKNTVKEMRKGNDQEKEAKLKAFWKAKDPSPDTEFNELMSEYYQRIDHAATAYKTGSGMFDGHNTDRGKIFIANGAPLRIERILPSSGGVRETWHYPNGKAFVFEAASSLDAFQLISK